MLSSMQFEQLQSEWIFLLAIFFFIHRFLWLVIMFAFGFGVFYLCYNQWARYKANPTVISLERDYRNWNGTMPAITLCYSIKYNRSLIEEYVFRFFIIIFI